MIYQYHKLPFILCEKINKMLGWNLLLLLLSKKLFSNKIGDKYHIPFTKSKSLCNDKHRDSDDGDKIIMNFFLPLKKQINK